MNARTTHARPRRPALSWAIATVWLFVVLIVILFAATDGNAQAPGSALARTPEAAPARPSPAATPSGVSIWPQAPYGQRAIDAPKTNPGPGVFGVEWTPANGVKVGTRAVITGKGFGERPGSVSLMEKMPGASFRVSAGHLDIRRWTDTRIEGVVAELRPTELGRSPDTPTVTVRTNAGTAYSQVSPW